MANWVDTVSKIGEIAVGLGSAIATGYSTVVVSQAQSGYFDSLSQMNLLQIDNAINTINERKDIKELNKQITAINGKIKNGLALTKDEYNFMVSNGYILSEYKLNEDGYATRIENTDSYSNDLKLTGLSLKGYLVLAIAVLVGIKIVRRIL